MNNKRITKSRKDRQLSGVLAGIANYFKVDATLVRLIFVLIAFFTGFLPCILAYIVADLIIPFEDVIENDSNKKEENDDNTTPNT